MITRLRIHNYRTFVDFEWTPPRTCVLVGANGSGKSAFVEVLLLLQDVLVYGKPYEETGYPGTLTKWTDDRAQSIEVEATIDGQIYVYELAYFDEGGGRGIREQLTCGGDLLYGSDGGKVRLYGDRPLARMLPQPRAEIPFGSQRSFIAFLEPRDDNRQIIAFREWFRRIWALKPDPLRLVSASQKEASRLEPSLSNFVSWYRGRAEEEPESVLALRNDLQLALPGFQVLRFQPVTPEVKQLRVKFGFGGTEYELGWGSLSDGQRLLIALYGALRFALHRASVVALDEIENYVSPAEIQPWFRALLDVSAESGAQLLVASHHPEAIDYLAADSVWRLNRDSQTGKSTIEPLTPDLDAGETAYELVKRLQSYA
jgi:predicted ATPase